MRTLTYNPYEHLSAADRERLDAEAAAEDKKPDEFIEATLKRRLWAQPTLPVPIPRPQLDGSRRRKASGE